MKTIRHVVLLLLLSACSAHGALLDPTPAADWDRLAGVLKKDIGDIRWRDEWGRSLVYYHLMFGSEDAALAALSKRPRSSVMMEGTERLIEYAIRKGSQKVVRALLDHGESPNAAKEGHVSPLMWAVSTGELEIARMLISAGAKLNYHSGDTTAVSAALSAGQYFAFRQLLDSGADLTTLKSATDSRNLLFSAISGNSSDAIADLLRLGFQVNGPRWDGLPPLHVAIARNSSLEVVQALLAGGADPCRRDSSGRTAIQLADQKKERSKNSMVGYRDMLPKQACEGK